jgi:UDP-3-O-[3-hydroxymyristoyl] glucosamine N-acyltransferase
MQATLAELAALVDGRLTGDGELVIRGAAPLRDAQPGDITLLDNPDRGNLLASSKASAVVIPDLFDGPGLPAIRVEDAHRAFALIISRFRPPRAESAIGVSPYATVSPTAVLGANVDIHPQASVGDDVEIGDGSIIHSGVRIMAGSKIGPDVTVFPNAVLYENTVVGPRSIIHAGAVLGAFGFGYSRRDGRHELSAQLGNVIVEADVEIGANTTIDRGTYGPTVIGEGTKIDNLVMIAHNCQVGRHNMLCAQVGIAGSTSTGDNVVMAGQVGVRDHVHIGEQAVLGAMAGIIGDVPDGARMVGIPATPERDQKIKQVAFAKLPEMRRQLRKLQGAVDQIVSRNGTPAVGNGPNGTS